MRETEILKQMIDFQKAMFDNMFNAVTVLQDQTEKMVNTYMDQAQRLPEEGREVIGEWVNTYKEGRQNFRKTVDDLFTNVE
ncbi:MAG: hypothetical protein JXC33_13375 [Deltaproteobacteria bacterium]|nr:hypothetical protein [Deltaproteobacteria bacterium]